VSPGTTAAEPDKLSAGPRIDRLAEGALKGARGAPERQVLAQVQGPKPDTGEDGEGTRTSPLRWLRYSSERFRTLMRMLAARSARYEAKAREEAKRAAEAKAEEDAKRAADARAVQEARLAEEAKRAAEAKAEEDAKRAADARAAHEAQLAEEAKRAAEAKAEEDAKRAADARAVHEARLAEEAKRAAEAKAAEDAKRVADAKAAQEARLAEEAKRAADAKMAAEPKTAAPTSDRHRRTTTATCKNAGVKLRGAGWYVAQVGDSLWSIARAHYGYGKAYRRIHAANRRHIPNANRIYPCQRIYIPRSMSGVAPAQDQRVALAPFVRRRPIRTGLPGLAAWAP